TLFIDEKVYKSFYFSSRDIILKLVIVRQPVAAIWFLIYKNIPLCLQWLGLIYTNLPGIFL
ncbi:MAG: hypothetical protein U9R34_08235, partial [Nanoarchaeota archaeon]|nr:hypothetical protein [Nanoarchaeota archaeon]